ncbi:glycosyltransferase family 2 protein, partial [Xanthomonas oryzae pv. oryzae]
HEAASVDGAVATLAGDLIHYPYRSLMQQLAKTQRYAQMMAEHEHARGKRATWSKLVLAPAWRFWRGYLLRGGFRDGWHGLIYAYVRANYVRQKTIMLWLLQHNQPVQDPARATDQRSE